MCSIVSFCLPASVRRITRRRWISKRNFIKCTPWAVLPSGIGVGHRKKGYATPSQVSTEMGVEADLWFLAPWARNPDCATHRFFVMQIIFALSLPLSCPSPLVPWTPAPVAYPSIHHWMGDVSLVYRLGVWPATQAKSAFYLQRDGKWVPAKGKWQCCDWACNRRSGIAPAMSHRLYGTCISSYWLDYLRTGNAVQHSAVGPFLLLVLRSGTRCPTRSVNKATRTVSNVNSKRFFSPGLWP